MVNLMTSSLLFITIFRAKSIPEIAKLYTFSDFKCDCKDVKLIIMKQLVSCFCFVFCKNVNEAYLCCLDTIFKCVTKKIVIKVIKTFEINTLTDQFFKNGLTRK